MEIKKKCPRCGNEKPTSEFPKDKRRKDGFYVYCKTCSNENGKKYYLNNVEKTKIAHKKWRDSNPEKAELSRKRWLENNVNRSRLYQKKWCDDNRDRVRERDRIYVQANHEKIRERTNKWYNEKMKNDPVFKLKRNISKSIRQSLKSNKNGYHWETLVGYTVNELKEHLEMQFKDGMIWGNHGYGKDKWHIDHIIPVSLFNITSARCKGFKKCWALENLRPMWQIENMRKSNKIFA